MGGWVGASACRSVQGYVYWLRQASTQIAPTLDHGICGVDQNEEADNGGGTAGANNPIEVGHFEALSRFSRLALLLLLFLLLPASSRLWL